MYLEESIQNVREFTYISTSNQVKIRLDHFYILNKLLSRVDSVITNFNTYSDHGMISLLFKDFDEEEFTYRPGYWKCNISTLDPTGFCEELKNIWSHLDNCEIKDRCWWETCKVEFKCLIILHSRKISLQYHQAVKQIENKLHHYYV